MKGKAKRPGEQLFEEFYLNQWGERWSGLRRALIRGKDHYALEEGLLRPYYMDRASLYPARALEAAPGEDILDMCAAPGGKSLILALALKGRGRLRLNDISTDRRRRLDRVITEHLPPEWRKNITLSGSDASLLYRREKSRFDRVLLDAPCSSEGHVINSPPHLKAWSPGRIRSLAPRQFSLLCSALEVVKPGGIIVYSTCALADEENDMIMERLYKKRSGRFALDLPDNIPGEKTRMGWHILPDRSGLGPIYLSRIRRLD